jgi:hypothetical protein
MGQRAEKREAAMVRPMIAARLSHELNGKI